MIGNTNSIPEHIIVPVLKFIDFGQTWEVPSGPPDNTWKISKVIHTDPEPPN